MVNISQVFVRDIYKFHSSEKTILSVIYGEDEATEFYLPELTMIEFLLCPIFDISDKCHHLVDVCFP